MRPSRPAVRSGAANAVSNSKDAAADGGAQLSEKEQAAKALDELHRLNSAVIAQWHNKKLKPNPPAIPPLDPPTPPPPTPTPPVLSAPPAPPPPPPPPRLPWLTSPASPSLHPYRHPLRFRTSFRNTILTCFLQREWRETQSETDWDVHWAGKEWIRYILPRVHLHSWQRVNHFATYYELTRKDLLIKNLKKARNALLKQQAAQVAAEYTFWPETFNLPSEYLLFADAFKRNAATGGGAMSNSWIMKPVGSSQGKGIFLVDKLTQIADWNNSLAASSASPQQQQAGSSDDGGGGGEGDAPVERYIVQRYLHNPLLIGGKKFDIRLYVLVTSYHPLTVYMHRSGFARFSSTRYTTVKGALGNTLVHLTNVAIQKHGDEYDASSGGKWEVGSLRSYLLQLQDEWREDSSTREDRVGRCFSLIATLVVRSLQAVQPLMARDAHCFELYGYDVLLDAAYKPWLIEVNASPSLSANTPADEQLKIDMLHDLFHTLEVERWTRERSKRRALWQTAASTKAAGGGGVAERRVGGFDQIFDESGGGLRQDEAGRAFCSLGLYNDRVNELQALWRRMARAERKDREMEARHAAEVKEKRDKQKERRKQAAAT